MKSDLLYKLLVYYPGPHALWRGIEAKLIKEVDFPRPLLDMGCGDGRFSSLLFSKIDVGLDIEFSGIKKAKSTEAYEHLVLADATRLPFKNGSFKSSLSNCVIEHIPNCDAVLKEIGRVLQKEGLFVFTVPSELFDDFLLPSIIFRFLDCTKTFYRLRLKKQLCHYHYYAPSIWEAKLERAALKTVKIAYYIAPSATLLWDSLHRIWSLKLGKYTFGGVVSKAPRKMTAKILHFLFYPSFQRHACEKGGGLFFVAETAN